MCRLTRLGAMRRLWHDASAAATTRLDWSLERGRQTGKKNLKARAAERGLRQVLLREGGRQELYEVIFPRFKLLSLHLVSKHAERRRNAGSYGIPCFLCTSKSASLSKIMRGRGDGVRRHTINNDKILRTWPPPVKHQSCRRAVFGAPKT